MYAIRSYYVVIVPYQRLYYYAQTSGILAEALGAGIPVVVPEGTWMAAEIEGKNVGKSRRNGEPDFQQRRNVITSYSIHYTKLYDGGCEAERAAAGLEPVAQAQSLCDHGTSAWRLSQVRPWA